MRIFVDVGAHYGETLEVALDPVWGFDRILVLEPASACLQVLRKFRDRRIRVSPVALGAVTESKALFGAGLLGASLFEAKRQTADPADIKTEQIQVIRASEWFRNNVPEQADVFMKLNCEGSECDIIDELLAAGLGPCLTSVYVDFDIRKVRGQAHLQAESERALLHHGVRYVTSDSLNCGANEAVTKWLLSDCSRKPVRTLDRFQYWLALYAPPYVRVKMLAQLLLPRPLYSWLGRRFGHLARQT